MNEALPELNVDFQTSFFGILYNDFPKTIDIMT